MSTLRTVQDTWRGIPTIEGAGVRLKRVFGFQQVPRLDPFLLLDDFSSTNPADYLSGFPWHPHRGIETITYLLAGQVEHGDSLGNQGVIAAGDVQWMTAGSGIIHQEMPRAAGDGQMTGFQLWANLPAAQKMMGPRYRDITSGQIPIAGLDGGVTVRVICGEVNGVRGPVQDIVIDPEYLDVEMPPNKKFYHPAQAGYTVFAYVFAGQACFNPGQGTAVVAGSIAALSDGDGLEIASGESGARFLLISGKPLKEPVAWYGPIVMNTREELQLALEEYRQGTFLKHQK